MATASGGEGGSRFRFLQTEMDFPALGKTNNKRKPNEEITYIDRNTGFKVTKVDYAEYYVIRCETQNKNFNKTSPFYIEIALNNQVGHGTDTKRLRDGTLLIKAKNDNQARKIANLKTLGDISVISQEHGTLNTCQGIIFHYDSLELTEDEILKGLQDQGQRVTKVTKIKKRINGELVDTPNCILTFKLSYVPSSIKFGFHTVKVQIYIPNPMKCVNCFMYGHPKKFCKNNKACSNCSNHFHGEQCSEIARCQGCGGEHNNFNKECPRYQREYEIQKIRVMEKLSYFDARTKFNVMYPNANTTSFSQTVRTSFDRNLTNTRNTASNNLSQSETVLPTEEINNQEPTKHTSSSHSIQTNQYKHSKLSLNKSVNSKPHTYNTTSPPPPNTFKQNSPPQTNTLKPTSLPHKQLENTPNSILDSNPNLHTVTSPPTASLLNVTSNSVSLNILSESHSSSSPQASKSDHIDNNQSLKSKSSSSSMDLT